MEWSRIKTIILIILGVTNLCLLSFLLQRTAQEKESQLTARQNAILFLQQQGIQVVDEIVPKTMALQAQIVERDRTQEQALAAALLGENVEEHPLGGEVYLYENEQGYLQFHSDGTIQGEFTPDVAPADGQNLGELTQTILKKLHMEGEEIASSSSSGKESGTAVTVRQLWSGVPLFSQQMTLNYRENALYSITDARRLVGTPQPNLERTPISIPTALIQFYNELSGMGDVCSQIHSITPGYVSTVSAGTGLIELIPVWYVSTDTGSYLLNTLSGQVSRADTLDHLNT